MFGNHPAAPKSTRSAMWLSILTTEMYSQLVFVLDTRSPKVGNSSFQKWPSPLNTGGGWPQTIQLGLFVGQLTALLPSFLRPFENGPHPILTVVAAKMLRPNADTTGLPGTVPVPVRVRAWEEGPCADVAASCLHVIVVNVLHTTPVRYTVEIESPAMVAEARQRHAAAPHGGYARAASPPPSTRFFFRFSVCVRGGWNAQTWVLISVRVHSVYGTRVNTALFMRASRLQKSRRHCNDNSDDDERDAGLFDAGYNVSLGLVGNKIVMEDYLGPGDVAICEGPKPTMGTDGVWSAWEPCANRRVKCWDHYSECSGV